MVGECNVRSTGLSFQCSRPQIDESIGRLYRVQCRLRPKSTPGHCEVNKYVVASGNGLKNTCENPNLATLPQKYDGKLMRNLGARDALFEMTLGYTNAQKGSRKSVIHGLGTAPG